MNGTNLSEDNKLHHVEYTIVIPCYNSSHTIDKVVSLLEEKFSDNSIQIILVDDFSPDNGKTAAAIRGLVKQYSNVLGIWLAKNSGQHNAVMCGLRHSRGDFVICMDDDLQTHPDEIFRLIEKLQEGYDVVYAYYPQKKQSLFRRIGSSFSSWTVRQLIGKPKGLKTSSFWIARRFVIDNLISYCIPYTFLPGLVLRTTNNIGNVEVRHYDRAYGESGYTLKKLIKLWMNIMGFSLRPLRFATTCGMLFALAGFIGTLVIIFRKLFLNVTVVGWSSLIVTICFFSGMILMFMGIIGEYIGRMFMADSNYPQYTVKDKEGCL